VPSNLVANMSDSPRGSSSSWDRGPNVKCRRFPRRRVVRCGRILTLPVDAARSVAASGPSRWQWDCRSPHSVEVRVRAGTLDHIQSFDADIAVDREGYIVVSERLHLYFAGSWNGITRSIPVKYRTPQGFHFDLKLGGVTVTDESGLPLKFERFTRRDLQEFKAWVPGQVTRRER